MLVASLLTLSAALPVALVTVAGCATSRPATAPAPALGPEPRGAMLWLGGDVHYGAHLGAALSELPAEVSGLPGVVNLEGPAGPQPAAAAGARVLLANAPGELGHLYEASVRVVGVANNHAADRGAEGEPATVAALRAVGLVAAGGSAGAARIRLGDLDVAVTAHDLSGGVPADLAAQLVAARAGADALVATFHVAGPPSYLPTPELEGAVDAAVAAGAAVVAAHGTHAVGPVERRGDAVIAWGLGNLVFACECTREVEALLLVASIDRAGRAGPARVLPIDAGLDGAPARRSPDTAGVVELLRALGSSELRAGDGGADL